MKKSDRCNIVSVSWSDHLIFGEGDGRLDTIDALQRRMQCWRDELGASIIHWRCTRDRIKGRYFAGKGCRHFYQSKKPKIDWDDFKSVPARAREYGFKVFLYVCLYFLPIFHHCVYVMIDSSPIENVTSFINSCPNLLLSIDLTYKHYYVFF